MIENRGGKNTHTYGYPWIKYVTGTVAKRIFMGIINGYLITQYFMDTDTYLIVPISDNKLGKLLKYSYFRIIWIFI